MYQPEIGVALANRFANGITLSMTDDFSHFCGEVIVTEAGEMSVVDKYGSYIPETNPLHPLMIAGATRYLEWAAKHE